MKIVAVLAIATILGAGIMGAIIGHSLALAEPVCYL